MAAAAALAALWFRQTVTIERLTGQTGYGPAYDAPEAALAAVDHRERAVLTPAGETVISPARVFLPATTSVPLGSRVTLPASHGGGSATVMVLAFHRSRVGTPDHVELVLT